VHKEPVKIDGYFEPIHFKNDQKTLKHLDLDHIMDEVGDYFYNYGGSETTPPCEENVNWIVMAKFMPLKKSEFRQFYAISTQFGRGNNREVQLDNSRPILLGYRGEPKIPGDPRDPTGKPDSALSSPTLQ